MLWNKNAQGKGTGGHGLQFHIALEGNKGAEG